MSPSPATKSARDRTTAEIAGALLGLGRLMTQLKVHETWCREAGVDLDRSGSALLFKLYVEGERLRLTDLAERLGIDSPAVTRKVQHLERRGLLRRSPDPDDARACRLELTAEGRRSIERLLRARERWLDDHLVGWSASDRREFSRLLQLFAATIAQETDGADDR